MTPTEAFATAERRATFRALAARIFGVDPSVLTDETTRGSLPAWDSINHLRLVMEAESAFGVRYSLERIPALESFGDFYKD